MQPIFKMAAATALAVGLTSGSLKADTVVYSHFQSPGTTVNVQYTAPNGSVVSHSGVQAGAFGLSATSGGSTFMDAYCATLAVTVPTGTTPLSIAPVLALHDMTNSATGYFKDSLYADVGNRLEFLLNEYGGVTNSSSDVRAALSLAIWNTIDENFKPLPASVSNPVGALYGAYIDWDNNGYVSGTVYNPNAVFLVTNNTPPYQNLIGIRTPDGPIPPAVPEPSSVAIVLGLVSLGVVGHYRARRKTA